MQLQFISVETKIQFDLVYCPFDMSLFVLQLPAEKANLTCPLFSLSSFRAVTSAVILVPVISPFTIFISH